MPAGFVSGMTPPVDWYVTPRMPSFSSPDDGCGPRKMGRIPQVQTWRTTMKTMLFGGALAAALAVATIVSAGPDTSHAGKPVMQSSAETDHLGKPVMKASAETDHLDKPVMKA